MAERRAGRPRALRLRRGALRCARRARVARISRTPRATMAAGLLLVAWIVVQLLVIRTLSFFHPAYLAIGLSFAWVGRRMERRERQGPADPDPGTIGPVAVARASRRIEA